MTKKSFYAAFFVVTLIAVGSFASTASASHSWGTYHWARSANPFTLKLGDNLTTNWDAYLSTASTGWTLSDVLNTSIVTGSTNPKNCRAVAGTVQVCNSKYGSNGWLGIAQIWISGSHITQGIAKMNDTYMTRAPYNTEAWKNLLVCQEIGHTFGLGHQDEDFANPPLGTCMDYSSNPIPNQHPNAHDYNMLESIYAHLTDGFNSYSIASALSRGASRAAQNGDFENASEWGKEIRKDSRGNGSLYERDLGKGNKIFTFVTWAN